MNYSEDVSPHHVSQIGVPPHAAPLQAVRALGRGIGVGWAAEGSLADRLLMTDFSSFDELGHVTNQPCRATFPLQILFL